MNPSAPNWIPKYLNAYDAVIYSARTLTLIDYYTCLKSTGFIYGATKNSLLDIPISDLKLTQEELTKVNLFHSLVYVFYRHHKSQDNEKAIATILNFYKSLNKDKTGLLHKLSFKNSATQNLERLLSNRLNDTNTQFRNNKTAILTYALLFVDVFAFSNWLHHNEGARSYADTFEFLAITNCYFALKSKDKKRKYDSLLIDLFESSSQYTGQRILNEQVFIDRSPFINCSEIEKQYLLDLCCIAVWDDRELDASEFNFLSRLTQAMELPETALHQSILDIERFTATSDKKLQLFEYTNPVRLFYKQATSTVKLLILRNKKRLLQELNESGELIVLLSSSTVRDLSVEEKNKVREQLLDICKTIPSLAIFLLPGGTVLLPLLVKFIPKLLPSAFNENRIED